MEEIPEYTIIYTRPTDHLLLLLSGLGTALYMIFFLVQSEYLLGFGCTGLSIFLIFKSLENSKSQVKLIIGADGIQIFGQPFVSWAMVHGLQVRLDIKREKKDETFVLTSNGRIQEFSIPRLVITSGQLEKLLEIYQERFRNGQVSD